MLYILPDLTLATLPRNRPAHRYKYLYLWAYQHKSKLLMKYFSITSQALKMKIATSNKFVLGLGIS